MSENTTPAVPDPEGQMRTRDPGAIPALALGQIVTDWLRERVNRIEGSDRG